MDAFVIIFIIFLFVCGAMMLMESPKKKKRLWNPIPDQYQSLKEVNRALRKAGLESSNLIIGIDYTKSNEWNGEKTFGGKCLHHIYKEETDIPGGVAVSVL
mmetsp:Transcript_20159/g.30198  ORF Transcript_20159/g.30198 Transcript_20159/m.30198 type:complete len:101 (+) Transcript_20159:45-347(+)